MRSGTAHSPALAHGGALPRGIKILNTIRATSATGARLGALRPSSMGVLRGRRSLCGLSCLRLSCRYLKHYANVTQPRGHIGLVALVKGSPPSQHAP
jgi:hypothetical protein